MSGGKETPRQKMIGMMYLVLTALLALNVSKEILNAFVIVENGLNTTNSVFEGKNKALYAKFKQSMQDSKAKTEHFNAKALEVQKEADSLCKMVDDIRSELYSRVQGITKGIESDTFHLAALDSKDNYDKPTHYLLGDNPEEPAADAPAIKLKNAIKAFKDNILQTPKGLGPEQIKTYQKEVKSVKLGLDIDDVTTDDGKVHWEFNNFDHTTMAADMCIFAAIKNDIRNAESDVVSLLLKSVAGQDFAFDKVEAKVVAHSDYIMQGDDYTADIFISAHNSAQNPTVKVDGQPNVQVAEGVGKFVAHTGAEGFQEYKGNIEVQAPDGSMKSYPFSGSYMVAKPSLAISPTKMNVFYIGVDNPVDISVAGAGPSQVKPSMSGGSIKDLGQGHYTVRVTTPGECKISVSVAQKDGTTKPMGVPVVFRVKKVPSPTASFAGVTGDGKVSKGELQSAAGLIPKLEDFVFDLKFPVVSWVMSMNVNGAFVDYSATGPGVTGQMRDLLTRAKSGGKVLIEQVKVQAPEGVRSIPGCVLKIK
ncbi:MAG: hypothetical protein JWP12_993 [Bacteroidetes bacterium]|nr:hypothetical protein [Bacteroidota bacterium]